jgi:hypothetical protein
MEEHLLVPIRSSAHLFCIANGDSYRLGEFAFVSVPTGRHRPFSSFYLAANFFMI